MKKLGLLISILVISYSALAINFSRVNVAWQYDLGSPIQMAHRVVSVDGKISVFLRIKTDSLTNWEYEFLNQDGYESEKHNVVSPIAIDTLLNADREILLRIDLGSDLKSLFVVNIFRFEEYYYYDIGLKIGSISFPPIYPVNKEGLPILSNYINRSGYQWKNSEYYYTMKYGESYGEADPPMADMKPLAPKATLDSSFSFVDSVDFETGYFYTVLADSTAASGLTVLRVPPYYPEYRKLTELVESMFYLTSDAEKKSLINSKDLKKNFDSFWINNFNTKPRARNAIRKYYNSIEQANRIFTDFKPGWKTDRGMIYIVYGRPNEVYRTNGLEEWYYDTGETFEYSVISSFFAARTYALRRSKELEESWFTAIANIRRGIK